MDSLGINGVWAECTGQARDTDCRKWAEGRTEVTVGVMLGSSEGREGICEVPVRTPGVLPGKSEKAYRYGGGRDSPRRGTLHLEEPWGVCRSHLKARATRNPLIQLPARGIIHPLTRQAH